MAQFRKFQQNKLWRDKLVDRMEQMGSKLHWQQLTDEEFDKHLRAKILEEVDEVIKATSIKELTDELADVLEVIKTFCMLYDVYFDSVVAKQIEKRADRGGFDGRKFVTIAEHEVGSFGEQYCLAQPEKYPEIE